MKSSEKGPFIVLRQNFYFQKGELVLDYSCYKTNIYKNSSYGCAWWCPQWLHKIQKQGCVAKNQMMSCAFGSQKWLHTYAPKKKIEKLKRGFFYLKQNKEKEGKESYFSLTRILLLMKICLLVTKLNMVNFSKFYTFPKLATFYGKPVWCNVIIFD